MAKTLMHGRVAQNYAAMGYYIVGAVTRQRKRHCRYEFGTYT